MARRRCGNEKNEEQKELGTKVSRLLPSVADMDCPGEQVQKVSTVEPAAGGRHDDISSRASHVLISQGKPDSLMLLALPPNSCL